MDLKDLERIRKEQAVRTTWKSVWRGMEERSNFRNVVLCTILIVLLPLVGVLGYLIARPALTRDEAVAVAHYDAAVVADGSSVAEEIADLAKLRNDGDITEDEYRRLKTKLV